MVDMQLLNNALLVVAVIIAVAVAVSITIVAVAGISRRGEANGRASWIRGSRGIGSDLPSAAMASDAEDTRQLVLR